ncbi:MAG: adenylate/guanylate cyclase domain-containing protein [Chloroflexi bacterium]|nr:adenylate/guanylate cyclase domain-containing protein [Chloroflexota bacterium]
MSRSRTASPDAVQGTIIFTDLAGFTEFTDERGDEAALRLLALKDKLVRETIGDRGRIVKNLGDGLMLWFENACDAIDAALRLQDQFEDESSVDDDLPLWVRIGAHYGQPTPRGDDFFGHDVNVAHRIVELAAPGEVLVSGALAEKVGDSLPEVTFDEVGPTLMKGIRDPVPLYRAYRAE